MHQLRGLSMDIYVGRVDMYIKVTGHDGFLGNVRRQHDYSLEIPRLSLIGCQMLNSGPGVR